MSKKLFFKIMIFFLLLLVIILIIINLISLGHKKLIISTTNFSEGLGVAQKGNKYGYINNIGSLVIPARFELAHDFINNFAIVRLNGKWGVINKKGKFVVSPQYNDILLHDTSFDVLDNNGWHKIILPLLP